MNAREWIDAFAAELGTDPPTNDEIKQVLDIAAVAAHSSERIAAPVACWVGGRAGASLDELQAAAERVGGTPEEAVRVAELWRYPVKGLRGESLERVDVAAERDPRRPLPAGARRARDRHRAAQAADDRPARDAQRRRRPARRRPSLALSRGRRRDPRGRRRRGQAEPSVRRPRARRRPHPAAQRRVGEPARLRPASLPAQHLLRGRRRSGRARLDRPPGADRRPRPLGRRAVRALRDHDDRPRHDRGRSRRAEADQRRARGQHGRLLQRRRAGCRSTVGDTVELI